MKRTPLKRGKPLRSRRWHTYPKPAAVIQRDLWREGLGRCALNMRGDHVCEGKVRGHHLIAQHALRKRGLHEFLWDKRNRLAVCDAAHHRHHTRCAPLPRSVLPDSVFEFAEELGLLWLLEKTYPEDAA